MRCACGAAGFANAKSAASAMSPQREDYINGGESREIVELALLDALAKFGVARKVYKKVKACRDQSSCTYVNIKPYIYTLLTACMHLYDL